MAKEKSDAPGDWSFKPGTRSVRVSLKTQQFQCAIHIKTQPQKNWELTQMGANGAKPESAKNPVLAHALCILRLFMANSGGNLRYSALICGSRNRAA